MESARELAKSEGQQSQAVAEDALREHIEAEQSPRPQGREHVMEGYLESTECYPELYKKLAQWASTTFWSKVVLPYMKTKSSNTEETQEFVLGLYDASNVTFENLCAWLGENTKAL